MIFEQSDKRPGASFLFLLACAVVVVYGMKLAAPILAPSALALFMAVLSVPVMMFLRRRRAPGWLAIGISILMNIAIFGVLMLLAVTSVAQFQERLPEYAASLDALQVLWIRALETRLGLPLAEHVNTGLVDPATIVDMAGRALGYAAQFASTTVLVFIVMSFMLAEAVVFPDKVRFLRGGKVPTDDRLAKVVGEVQSYLTIKTAVSLAVGILLGIWCWYLELDFPVLLGLTAFILHFVPTVGSIIAAFPAILLSLVIYGSVPHALAVAGGYLVVNMLLGNVLEPQLQGRRLGLSTLVVVLSLLFWGWAWGALGAFLAVPLTVVVKIWLENTRDLKWIAVLLDPSAPKAREPGPRAKEGAEGS
ncbi:MAG: AI-2E family transporter [Longimicrobiales bacterium]|nr:AI-2E family transporter [Longimicrobiales bacterium]